MRHGNANRKLNRTSSHRAAMLRNMANSLLTILSAMNFSWEIHECITLRGQTGNSPKGGRIQWETMLSFNSTVLVWWRTTRCAERKFFQYIW